jgi:site-specific DNA recombinase
MPSRRAIGIVRVSRSSGRTGESFSSPQDQVDRLRALADEQDWAIEIPEPYEIDVSGDALLTDRPQLSRAVLAVQTGQADVIAGAHTERLWWNHETATQVIRLVEDANGEVWSADQGLLTRRSAADEFSGTVRTAADRLSRRQNTEKTATAIQRAISRGVAPYGHVPAGYMKTDGGRYEPDPATAPVVADAFRLRAAGGTVDDVWQHLQTSQVQITYSGAYALLHSRVYLGEIHFGKFEPNLAAHEPLIDQETWHAVQRARSPSGRKPKSERLLARLGVLRCGTCNSRLAGSTATGATSRGGGGGRTYPIYRCGNKACARPVSISAASVEEQVVAQVRAEFADVRGRASVESRALAAEALLEHAQAELDAAIRTLSVVGDEPATIQRLAGLRDARDRARVEAERLGGLSVAKAVDLRHWDRFTVEEQRAAIRGTVKRAVVAPGRGAGRVSVEFF